MAVLVAMPIKSDIKHDWYLLESKIYNLQKQWKIKPTIPCDWLISSQELANRLE